jgi:hypothetical protein
MIIMAMKRIIYLSKLILFLLLLTTQCCVPKDEALPPGITIYKTNGDYFDLTTVGIKDNQIFRRPSYTLSSYKFIFSDQDTIYKYREKLISGYILDCESDERYDVFLDLNFKQHMMLEEACERTTLPDDTIRNHILDENPYIEFYRDNSVPRKFNNLTEDIDTAEINQIIREGNLEQFFTRLK